MTEGKDFKYLVRILNTDLDGNKATGIELRKIKGVNFMYANIICTMAGIDPKKKVGNLSDAELKAIDTVIHRPAESGVPVWMMNRRNDPATGETTHLFTSDIALARDNDIKMLKKIRAYRGVRHALGQPTRGQRTKSNFRRNKGTVLGVVRKKVAAPEKA
ncbi:MAG: 30S ribosomal protein S13 [Nanoarchaeota archaeon]